MQPREHYGIDAPTVVRNLAIGGAALVIAGLIMTGRNIHAGGSLQFAGFFMVVTAGWMLASSLWFKGMVMRKLVDQHQWRGDECVLDVGSGKGLVAVEATRRAGRGKVYAIDLWRDDDLSGNGPGALLTNAGIADVGSRLAVCTGDARHMPYPDLIFDVVTSMTAIHNIRDQQGRQSAIAEIWRVTKPGGQILIFDIWYARSYLQYLRTLGATDTKLLGPSLLWGLIGWTLVAHKPLVTISPAC